MNRDPLADARSEGLRVEVARFGTWAPARVVAEYDRAARTIRVNAAALERLRIERGDDAANALLAAAVAHELYHHEVAEGRLSAREANDRQPRQRHCPELEVHAERYAREKYGIDQRAFESMLSQ